MTQPGEDNDPVVETYDLYLTPSVKSVGAASLNPESSIIPKFLLLQYPDRRQTQPYKASTHQKPASFRLKPRTGLVEVDVPIDTENNYNASKGDQYASSICRSKILSAGGSQGLAGGFNTGPPVSSNQRDMDIISQPGDNKLHTQKLAGKIKQPAEGDPVYMLGYLKDNAIHLNRLDALVQLRPQLPHLDAGDEVQRIVERTKVKKEPGETSSKSQARAVEMKISRVEKTPEEAARARNEALLQSIQEEKWTTYRWHDHDTFESACQYDKCLRMPFADDAVQLQASMDNSAWLDVISAPRIDPGTGKAGSMGLMGKVKGREREKRRRKNSEKRRRQREQASAITFTTADMRADEEEIESEETDSESEGSEQDVQMVDQASALPSASTRKDNAPVMGMGTEGSNSAGFSSQAQTQPRRRGRPPKNASKVVDAMVID